GTAAAMCHGYYKVAKKPMACMVHGTVGLQHASMAIYNAFADRVPMLVLTGNIGNPATRQVYIEWNHSAQDQGATVRDITKWDDQPTSLQGFAESVVDAHNRMNMANRHPHNHSSRREAALQAADVILALEPIDLWGLNNYVPDLVTRPNDPRRRQAGLKIIHIGTEHMMAKSNYQDF